MSEKKITFISILESGLNESLNGEELANYISENLPENLKSKYNLSKILMKMGADIKYVEKKKQKKEEKLKGKIIEK